GGGTDGADGGENGGGVGGWYWIDRDEIASVERARLAEDPAAAGGDGMAVAVVPIGLGSNADVLGAHVTAEGVYEALRAVEEQARGLGIDPGEGLAVVFQFSSRGGVLAEVPWLVEIVEWSEARYAVVAGVVVRAESAAALVALACDRLVFVPSGVMGGSVAFVEDGAGVRGVGGALRDDAVSIAERASAAGGRDAALGVAMSTRSGLLMDPATGTLAAGDVDGGEAADDGGVVVINRGGTVLVLSAMDAERVGVSEGTAGDFGQIVRVLGIGRVSRVLTGTALDVLVRRAEAAAFVRAHAEVLGDSVVSSLERLEDGSMGEGEREMTVEQAWRELDRLVALVGAFGHLSRHAAFTPSWLGDQAARLGEHGARGE
ncbi:MAG: hypothetical protein ACTS3F_12380, partial [Phycisphaerales bacterium]